MRLPHAKPEYTLQSLSAPHLYPPLKHVSQLIVMSLPQDKNTVPAFQHYPVFYFPDGNIILQVPFAATWQAIYDNLTNHRPVTGCSSVCTGQYCVSTRPSGQAAFPCLSHHNRKSIRSPFAALANSLFRMTHRDGRTDEMALIIAHESEVFADFVSLMHPL